MAELNAHIDEGAIHAWLDGALAPDESARIERHVAVCDSCAALVSEARGLVAASSRIMSSLDSVPGDVIPGGASADPLARLRAHRAATARRWWRQPQFLAAASLVFLAGTGTVIWRSLRVPAESVVTAPTEPGPEPAAAAPPPAAEAPRVASTAPSPPRMERATPDVNRADAEARVMKPDEAKAVAAADRADVAVTQGQRSQVLSQPDSVATQRQAGAAAANQRPVSAAPAPLRLSETVVSATDVAGRAGLREPQARELVAGAAGGAANMLQSIAAKRLAAGAPECYELRDAEAGGVRLLGVPDQVRLVPVVASRDGSEALEASPVGSSSSGVSLVATAVAGQANVVDLVVRRPLDSTIVRFTRSAVPLPTLSPADVSAGVKVAVARRVVCER